MHKMVDGHWQFLYMYSRKFHLAEYTIKSLIKLCTNLVHLNRIYILNI